jgi:DNA-directed RNA polymerase subunit RPC12/RpoP
MRWYQRVKFDCVGCGARLIVESGQIARREIVTCSECNADLVLTPRETRQGADAEAAGGPTARPIPKDAFLVEL